MPDTTQVSKTQTDAGGSVLDAVYSRLTSSLVDPATAKGHAARAASHTIEAPSWAIGFIGGVLSFLARGAAIILDTITKSKLAGQPGIHDLIVSALADVLQLDLSPDDVPVGKGPAGQRAVNTVLGQKFLTQLKTLLGADGAVTGDSAEKGAAAFLGFGMQLSASTAFLGVLGELFSLGHVQDVAEVGEMLEKSLGMGRLTRRLLGPYLRNVIEQPLDRKLRAQYRQDVLGVHELIKAIFRNGTLTPQARALLAQHGLPEDQINELIDQQRPHLSEGELDTLIFYEELDQPGAEAHLQSAGVPTAISKLKFRALTLQRLARLREAGMSEVLSLIQSGKLPQSAIRDAAATFGIPPIELNLWTARAAVYAHVRRRELSKGDVAFLYEHNQFTLDELQTWLDEEGYDQHDQLALTVEMVQKKTDLQAKQAAASSLKPKALHNQRVAFVTREWESIFGTPIPPDQLTKYVQLLDSGERTRTDVTAELKLLAGK